MQWEHSKEGSSSSNDHVAGTVLVALYFPSPAPLHSGAEFRNNYPSLGLRSVLLKGFSRTTKTSLPYKKSFAGFKNVASITLCGFVVCNVSYTEIFQVITHAGRSWEWKKAHGPISKTHSKIYCCFTGMNSTWWFMVIIGLHAGTNPHGLTFLSLKEILKIFVFLKEENHLHCSIVIL